MELYSLNSATKAGENVTAQSIKSISVFNNKIILCSFDEFNSLRKNISIFANDKAHLKFQDSHISYRTHNDYDKVLLQFVDHMNKHINYAVYLSDTFIFFVLPHDNDAITASIKQFLIDNIKDKTTKNKLTITNIFYSFLDIYVQLSSISFEKVEDKIEDLDKIIQSSVYKNLSNYVNDILEVSKTAYSIKKNTRAVSNVIDGLGINYNDFLDTKFDHIYDTLKLRFKSLLQFGESVYSFSQQLINDYHANINLKTNLLVTRLTAVMIIFSVWTIVVGIYGMNFANMPELDWQYGYFMVIGILIAISIVLLVIFKIKKWI